MRVLLFCKGRVHYLTYLKLRLIIHHICYQSKYLCIYAALVQFDSVEVL